MTDVPLVFLGVAAVALVGFLAARVFERTRFPDAPLLLGLGLVLGPGNRYAAAHGVGLPWLAALLEPERLRDAAPVIAALALVVLMFDSGMELDLIAFRRSLGPASLFTFPVFLLTVSLVSLVGTALLGMPPVVGIALGLALVNVDQAVSAGVLRSLRLSEELRSFYFVEMALYDLLSIPIMVSLLQIAEGAQGGTAPLVLLVRFATMASVSLVVGAAVGIPWMYALVHLSGHPNSYMLTFASALGAYGLSELLGGSGPITILVFGLLVGNRVHLLRRFGGLRKAGLEHEKVQSFHQEIAFAVRTVFFLYLGAIFGLGEGVRWPVRLGWLGDGTWLIGLAAMVLLVALVVARYVPVRVAAQGRRARRDLMVVFGRGLDTAVLATLPFLTGGFRDGTAYYALFAPWERVFADLSLILIVLTVLASGVFVFRARHLHPSPPE